MEEISHLVYVSPVRLHSAVQRPHHFVAWARQRWGCKVTWIDPYPVRLPTAGDLIGLHGKSTTQQERLIGPIWANEPWLHRLSVPAVPLDPFWLGRRLNRRLRSRVVEALRRDLTENATALLAVGRPCDLATQLVGFAKQRSLYDVMDDMPQFYKGVSSRWMARAHAQLLETCGTVWCSSSTLKQSASALGRMDCVQVGNAGPGSPLMDTHDRTRGKPWVAGYVGTLGPWFDWKILSAWANQLPDVRFEVVGALPAEVPASLPLNVKLMGPWPHQKVMKAMQTDWDVGLIPFKITRLTHAVDPVKYYEYRQSGLPVLSSKFGEMAHKLNDDGVWLMDDLTPPELLLRLGHWWNNPVIPETQSASDWQMTWSTRFDQAMRHADARITGTTGLS